MVGELAVFPLSRRIEMAQKGAVMLLVEVAQWVGVGVGGWVV